MQLFRPGRIDADRRLGWLVLLGGLALALAIQLGAPIGIPLYDGVVVQEPYRYLHPEPGQAGNPTSFTSSPTLTGPVSPRFAAATTESPPQIQLIAQDDAFTLPPGTTAINVSITPVEPPPVPPPGPIAGNVYRVSVTDQRGAALAFKPCEGCVILVVRAPEGTGPATLQRFADGTWTDVQADHVPTTGMYAWNPTALGDFAIVTGASGGGGPNSLVIVGGVIVVALLIIGAFAFRTATHEKRAAEGAGVDVRRRSPGLPSKRKRPPGSKRNSPTRPRRRHGDSPDNPPTGSSEP
ncbi:MAG TPA: hypothetical protein VNL94_00575 [Candidatus Binatia bacterium]|nr:hypothetical protein [Candidatus Binatia bacterium]